MIIHIFSSFRLRILSSQILFPFLLFILVILQLKFVAIRQLKMHKMKSNQQIDDWLDAKLSSVDHWRVMTSGSFKAYCKRSAVTFFRSQWQGLLRTFTSTCKCARTKLDTFEHFTTNISQHFSDCISNRHPYSYLIDSHFQHGIFLAAFCWRLGAKILGAKIASTDDEKWEQNICKLKINEQHLENMFGGTAAEILPKNI